MNTVNFSLHSVVVRCAFHVNGSPPVILHAMVEFIDDEYRVQLIARDGCLHPNHKSPAVINLVQSVIDYAKMLGLGKI